MNKVKDEVHMSSCRCDLCEALRKGEDITKKEEPSQQEQVREWIEEQKAKDAPGRVYGMPASESTLDYTADSLVSKQNNRIQELVNAHWSYMEKVLSTGQDKQQTFTWEQMMEIRKWDYTSSAIHFYGHGYEDAVNNQQEMKETTRIAKEMFVKLKEKNK